MTLNLPGPTSVPELHTHRLLLRRLEPADAQAVYDLFADPAVTLYHDIEPFTRLQLAALWLERVAQRQTQGTALRWGIVKRETGRLAGTGGYVAFDQRYKRGTLGYELAQREWGRGLMPEALTAMIRFGFDKIGLNRIEAYVAPGNTQSARVLEKLGFTDEAVLREYGFWKGKYWDLRLFALLKKEFVEP